MVSLPTSSHVPRRRLLNGSLFALVLGLHAAVLFKLLRLEEGSEARYESAPAARLQISLLDGIPTTGEPSTSPESKRAFGGLPTGYQSVQAEAGGTSAAAPTPNTVAPPTAAMPGASQIAPAQVAPVKVAPVKVAPVKVAPVKVAPVKVAPAQVRSTEETKTATAGSVASATPVAAQPETSSVSESDIGSAHTGHQEARVAPSEQAAAQAQGKGVPTQNLGANRADADTMPTVETRPPPTAPRKTAPRVDASWSGNLPPPYPPLARRLKLEGEVWLSVHVNADGRVLEASITRGSGHDLLDATAVESVKKWRFEPATLDGKPVADWYHDWRWRFRIHD